MSTTTTTNANSNATGNKTSGPNVYNSIEKIKKIKDLIISLETNTNQKLFHANKKNESLKRSDLKINELLLKNTDDHININCQDDKVTTLEKNFIDSCPLKTILKLKAEKSKSIFIDISYPYIVHAIDIMRKSLLDGKFKILIYPKDKINKNIMNEFLKYFFLLKEEEIKNFPLKLEYIPEKEKFVYVPQAPNIVFLNDNQISSLLKKSNKEQQNREKKLLLEKTNIKATNSFFIVSEKEETDYFSGMFDEVIEFED